MERHKEAAREVVEVYRQPVCGEVVEVYRRPLPQDGTPARQRKNAPLPRRSSKKGLWIFLICFAGVVLLAGAAWLWVWPGPQLTRDPFEKYPGEVYTDAEPQEITIPAAPAGQGVKLELHERSGEILTAGEIYSAVNPSVVTVLVQVEDGMSVGTGVIFTEDGYILTNHHVVQGGEACMVMLDTGASYDAWYVAGDSVSDLAVLKIEGTGLPAAQFGDSDQLSVGDTVYAIGNPLGVELRGTLTDGIVSAINRDVWVDERYMTLIQTNAALNTGNSGGPLIDQYGQVIGINVIKMTSQDSNVEGLGFAIPSASLLRITNDLLTFGQPQPEPVLGVTVSIAGVELMEDLWGLEVLEVTPQLPGAEAGIREGDFLLTAQGQPLRTSADLLRVRRGLYVGDTLEISLWRSGQVLNVTLLLDQAVESEPALTPWYVQ